MGCSFYTIFSRFAGQGGGGSIHRFVLLGLGQWGRGKWPWQVALTRALGGWNAGFGTDQYFFERVGP